MPTLMVDRIADIFLRDRQTKPSPRLHSSPAAFMSTARERIDENTTVSFSAVWRGLNLLSGVMARMPKSLVREVDEANKTLVTDLPLARLLRRRVSIEQTTPKWFEHMTMMTMLWGQSYSEIVLGGEAGIELFPMHPSKTKAVRDQRTGVLGYEYTEGGTINRLPAESVLHITTPGLDGITGLGLMELAKHSVGLALALQKYGGAMFGNNAVPGLVLEHPQTLGPEGMKNLRESIEARHRGAENAHTPLILEEEMKASTLTPPNDSMQFNETRGFQVVELARYMGIGPHLLYWLDRATFSNIEHLGIEFVKHTVDDWISRFTSEMEVKLLSDPALQIVIDTSDIERGDSETFSKVLERQVQNGIITFNEARRALGKNSLGPEGDIRVINKAMQDVERLEDEPQEPPPMLPQAVPGEPEPEPEPEDEGEDEQDRARRAAAIVLRESMEGLIRVECERLGRVLKKGAAAGDTEKRIDAFYDEFDGRVNEAFMPAFASFSVFTGSEPGDIVGVAAEYASTHRQMLLDELEAGHDPATVLDEWRNNRADQVTDMYFGGSNNGA